MVSGKEIRVYLEYGEAYENVWRIVGICERLIGCAQFRAQTSCDERICLWRAVHGTGSAPCATANENSGASPIQGSGRGPLGKEHRGHVYDCILRTRRILCLLQCLTSSTNAAT